MFVLRHLVALGALLLGFLAMPIAATAQTLADRIAMLEPAMSITKPEGPGPFPTVVMLHGCGGRRPFHDDIAHMLAEHGAAAIVVDSFAPRRISRIQAYSTVCTGAQLQGRERAGDLYASVIWARRQPWANPNQIIIAGWSHGGWTIIDALALRSGAEMARATGISDLPAEPLEGVSGALLAYPYAGFVTLTGRRDWRIAPYSVAILAGRDYIVGWKKPRESLERQRARGAPIDIVFFENSTHAFEDEDAHDFRVAYDADATAREYTILRDLVARVSATPQPAR
jgi:dienelactone hydrolase